MSLHFNKEEEKKSGKFDAVLMYLIFAFIMYLCFR